MCGGSGAPGTDEERAERLARMMSAQCTLEPPEVVGLRTVRSHCAQLTWLTKLLAEEDFVSI